MKWLFDQLVAAIASFFGPLIQTLHNRLWARIRDVCTWVLDLLWDLASSAMSFVWALLPSSVTSFLAQNIFTPTIKDGLNSVSYFFPVWEMLAIVATAIGLVTTIRGIRWMLSFVPGMTG